MSIRNDWRLNPVRRNFRGGRVVLSGGPLLTTRRARSRAWQRDVARRLPKLAHASPRAAGGEIGDRSAATESRSFRPWLDALWAGARGALQSF